MKNGYIFVSAIAGCLGLFLVDYFAFHEVNWQRNLIVAGVILIAMLIWQPIRSRVTRQ